MFLFCGLVTVITAPFVYWKLDSDITTARFLTEHERLQGAERLRANNDSVEGSHQFKWGQVLEAFIDPKTWLWVILALLPNLGSALPSFFGPLLIEGFGFDPYQTLLLNMPFGALQTIVIILGCWAAHHMRIKSVILLVCMLPVVAGTAMLYSIPRGTGQEAALLAAYYIIAFLFSANPLLLSWMVGNTAGATKKAVTVSLYQAGSSAGALTGPLLFTEDQAPDYLKAILSVMGVFIAMIACIIIQTAILFVMNKFQEKRRVRNGKDAKIVDRSMQKAMTQTDGKTQDEVLVDEAPPDITDRENDEFVYIL
ncbi:MFS transporter [Candidatus Bathyarchaeota archaeon]|nr:MFS transporter [Candidatus Bathyarchaeota archaeon]